MTSGTSTARCQFGPLTVEYDARVLTPRPWTLAQSSWAAELVRARRTEAPLLELCAGAGHIGLAAAVLAGCDLIQVEGDPVAAGYAAANAARSGWTARTQIRVAALQEAVQADERFVLILADPPYLPSSAVARWPQDPVSAIDGGADGLDLTRACLQLAARHLDPGGSVLLQVAGPAQADEVGQLVLDRPEWSLEPVELRTTDAQRAVLRLDRA